MNNSDSEFDNLDDNLFVDILNTIDIIPSTPPDDALLKANSSSSSSNNFRTRFLKTVASGNAEANQNENKNQTTNFSENIDAIFTDPETFQMDMKTHPQKRPAEFFSGSIETIKSNDCDLKKSSQIKVLNSSNEPNVSHFAPPNPKLIVKKRKFPGPAGLLPSQNDLLYEREAICTEDSKSDASGSNMVEEYDICSQNVVSTFSCGTWLKMLDDLNFDLDSEICPLYLLNINRFLQEKSLLKQSSICKTPFLVVYIKNIDTSTHEATINLKDLSGEMNGSISDAVMQQYASYLAVGSVLLLQDATIIAPTPKSFICINASKRKYISITMSSLVAIYYEHNDGDYGVVKLKSYSGKDILNAAASFQSTGVRRAIIEEEIETTANQSSLQSSIPHVQQINPPNVMWRKPNINSSTYSMPLSVNERPAFNCTNKVNKNINQQSRQASLHLIGSPNFAGAFNKTTLNNLNTINTSTQNSTKSSNTFLPSRKPSNVNPCHPKSIITTNISKVRTSSVPQRASSYAARLSNDKRDVFSKTSTLLCNRLSKNSNSEADFGDDDIEAAMISINTDNLL